MRKEKFRSRLLEMEAVANKKNEKFYDNLLESASDSQILGVLWLFGDLNLDNLIEAAEDRGYIELASMARKERRFFMNRDYSVLVNARGVPLRQLLRILRASNEDLILRAVQEGKYTMPLYLISLLPREELDMLALGCLSRLEGPYKDQA